MYVFEICAEGIFVTFPWWLENVKSRSKIALFSNERHFEIWFPKKRTITFFWGKLYKLHKKDPILHVATIFSLKQGETRTSHGPIPHPLNYVVYITQSMKLVNNFSERCFVFDWFVTSLYIKATFPHKFWWLSHRFVGASHFKGLQSIEMLSWLNVYVRGWINCQLKMRFPWVL